MLFPIAPIKVDPQKIAFQMCESGEQVTFKQLEERANQVAHLISDLGLHPGDHVAVLMNNCRELLELCFGLDRSGVYYTLISTRLTVDEIDYIIRDCNARLFVYDANLESVNSTFFSRLPDSLQCMRVGACDEQWGHMDWCVQCSIKSTTPIPEALQGSDMLYSSGTTGRPKGVLWPLPKTAAGQETMLVKLLPPLFGYSSDLSLIHI